MALCSLLSLPLFLGTTAVSLEPFDDGTYPPLPNSISSDSVPTRGRTGDSNSGYRRVLQFNSGHANGLMNGSPDIRKETLGYGIATNMSQESGELERTSKERERGEAIPNGGGIMPGVGSVDGAGGAGPDPFGNEEGNKIKYKTMTWWYV